MATIRGREAVWEEGPERGCVHEAFPHGCRGGRWICPKCGFSTWVTTCGNDAGWSIGPNSQLAQFERHDCSTGKVPALPPEDWDEEVVEERPVARGGAW